MSITDNLRTYFKSKSTEKDRKGFVLIVGVNKTGMGIIINL